MDRGWSGRKSVARRHKEKNLGKRGSACLWRLTWTSCVPINCVRFQCDSAFCRYWYLDSAFSFLRTLLNWAFSLSPPAQTTVSSRICQSNCDNSNYYTTHLHRTPQSRGRASRANCLCWAWRWCRRGHALQGQELDCIVLPLL